jgi:hypothetical protein
MQTAKKGRWPVWAWIVSGFVFIIFLIFVLAIIFGSKDVSSNGLKIDSINTYSAMPTEMLSLVIEIPDSLADSNIIVRFSDDKNYKVDVSLIYYNQQAAIVSIPIYFTDTGNFSSGVVNVELVANSGDEEYVSNKITGFEIEDLPTVKEKPGTITLEYLTRMIDTSNSVIGKLAQVDIKNVSTNELRKSLVSQRDYLVGLKKNVSSAMQNQSNNYVFGNFNGQELKLDEETLGLSDRIIAGYLLQYQESYQAGITGNSVSSGSEVTLESLGASFDTMFNNIREGLKENKEKITSLGETMVGLGGAIAVVNPAVGVTVAGLGAIVWFTGLHVNTAVIMATDLSIETALNENSGLSVEDFGSYFQAVFSKGISSWASETETFSGYLFDNIYTLAGTADLVDKLNVDLSQHVGEDINVPDVPGTNLTDKTDSNTSIRNDGTAILMIDKLGEGDGVIWDGQSFINCPGVCTHIYWIGTQVTLYAQARSAGTTFLGWEGGGCSGTGSSCVVTLERDTAITAEFQRDTNYNPPSGGGNGQCGGTSSSNACGGCSSDANCGGGHCWFNVGTAPFC